MPFIRRAMTPPEQRARRFPSLTGTSTGAGVSITPERSLQIGAVYSCVRLLSEAVSGLPVGMFERRDNARYPVEDHPILSLVKESPNPDIDAGELWRTVIGWMLLRGNAYVYVERGGGGQVKGLWPISPSSVEVKRGTSGRLFYTVRLDEAEYAPVSQGQTVPADRMLHYRAFGLGVEGLSPIGLARQSVGIAFAAQQYGAGFFARDASPGGVVSVDGELTDEQYERLTQQWKSLHQGFDKAHQLAVMEGGAKWEQTTLAPDDAQFIETQKFTRGEIASIFGVPPHMIGDTEKSTSWGSGIAEQGIGFVTYSLRPWLNRLERVTGRLITEPTRKLRWDVDGLMEGDTKARYEAYATAKQWGWMSTNDILRKEDEAPIEGGDDYLQPLNMVPAGSPRPSAQRVRYSPDGSYEIRATREVEETPAEDAVPWVTRHRDVIVAALEEQRGDVLARLAAGEAVLLDREEWDPRLAALLTTPAVGLTDELASASASALGGYYDPARAAAYLSATSAAHARNMNITTADELDRALADDESDETPERRVNRTFDQARDVRASEVAGALVNQLGNFAEHEGAYQAGARTKTWRTTSQDPRSAHARMNGETVPIDQEFSNGMQWPGDSSDIKQVAGCKCRLEYGVEEA